MEATSVDANHLFGCTFLALLLCFAACGGDKSEERMSVEPLSERSVDEVTAREWEALASRQVFFGHQSVGENIVAGIRGVLEQRPEIPLRIVSSEHPEQVNGTAFIEARIGENRDPASKSRAFADILEQGFGEQPGAIAMYKFCYVDIGPETDPERLFEHYVENVEALEQRYPDLVIVHVTVPLRTAPTGLWERFKTRIGRDTETRLNLKRARYNGLLRNRYGDDEIFDLALLESIRSDGSRATSLNRGSDIPMLAPDWTYDGGHLNEKGRRRIAEHLLVFLADVAERANNARRPDSNSQTATAG